MYPQMVLMEPVVRKFAGKSSYKPRTEAAFMIRGLK
jgi:hypothetical protein